MCNLSLVSLGIACYNHEYYIQDCIQSILDQDYPNIELIINDDCSTDRSVKILTKYIPQLEKKFISVKVLESKINLGICKSVNNIIKSCNGDYIKLFASDDLLTPNCISSLVKYMETNKDKIVCFTNGYVVGDKFRYGDKVLKSDLINNPGFSLEKKDLFKRLLINNFINTVGMMIRSEAYLKYGLYDEDLPYEDYDMWLRLSRTEKFGYLDSCLVYYRRAETSISNILTKEGKRKFIYMIFGEKKIYKKHLKYVNVNERKYYKHYFYNKVLILAINYKFWDVVYKWIKIMIRNNITFDNDTIYAIKNSGFILKLIYLVKIRNKINE